jgi:hypothetical protein
MDNVSTFVARELKMPKIVYPPTIQIPKLHFYSTLYRFEQLADALHLDSLFHFLQKKGENAEIVEISTFYPVADIPERKWQIKMSEKVGVESCW